MDFKSQFSQEFERLKNADPAYTLFGASTHEYKFSPKLNISDILTFEKTHDITLPSSYKTYLTEFGNGGAGPSYGIFALGNMDHNHDEAPWPGYIKPGATFRFTEAHNNDDKLDDGEPAERNFKTKAEFEEAHEYWYYATREPRQDQYYEDHALDGAIPICHHGCGQRSWLVVDEKSPEFGNIWEDLVADEEGVSPALNRKGDRINFADWILDWCSKSILELESNTTI